MRLNVVSICAGAMLLAGSAAAQQSPVERGKYLADGLGSCISCHTPEDGPMQGKAYAGGRVFGGDKGPFQLCPGHGGGPGCHRRVPADHKASGDAVMRYGGTGA